MDDMIWHSVSYHGSVMHQERYIFNFLNDAFLYRTSVLLNDHIDLDYRTKKFPASS